MSVFVWAMVGIAFWHFAVLVPDKFTGGIIGAFLAAVAGALLGPIFVVNPTMGDLAGLKAFAIVILGGLGNVVGATLGGFVLGWVEEFGAGYVSTGYRDAMGFILIMVVLALRPQGLFAAKERVG